MITSKMEYIDVSDLVDTVISVDEGREILRKFVEDLDKHPELFRAPFSECIFRYSIPSKPGSTYHVKLSEDSLSLDNGLKRMRLDLTARPSWISSDSDDGFLFQINYNSIGERDSRFSVAQIIDGQPVKVHQDEWYLVIVLCLPVIKGIIMLNCRNVRLVPEPKSGLKELLNRHSKKQKIVYKVLVVDLMKPKTKSDHESIETGIKKSLHICRGHFRTYTTEKPLFGRLIGTYFIPAHMRGTSDVGIIEKDYKFIKNTASK